MTPSITLQPGAWVVRIDTAQRAWTPEIVAASSGTDHVTATVGKTSALFGGVMHNRAELVQLLGAEPGGNNAALVIRAYAKWGESAIERVLGSSAIVICDAARPIVVAARDRLGTYPLFFAESGTAIHVSNSIDALLAQDGVSNELNLAVVVDHLRHVWPFADETYFEGIRRVAPGNVLRRDTYGMKLRRYWNPAPKGHVEWVRADEIEQFDVLFEEAVARCQASGPVGIFLSGGLDSVSVAAVATSSARAAEAPDPLALSLAFPHPDANETAIQRAVAASLGLEQVLLDWDMAVGPRGLVSEWLELCTQAPSPLLNLWMPAYNRLATAGRERGCETILTGGGGDEWLIVSPYYSADLVRSLDLAGLARLYNEHRRSHNVSALRYLRNIVWTFSLRPLAVDATVSILSRRAPSLLRAATLGRLKEKTPPWLAPDPALRQEMTERELLRRAEQWTGTADHDGADRRYPRIYFTEVRSAMEHPLVSMEHEELYWQGRRLGVNMLQPFWDASLVEFLYRTPPKLLNEGGRSKALVRRVLARRFPELGFERQRKVVATGFVRTLVDREGSRAWSTFRDLRALEDSGVVDGAALRRRLDLALGNRDARRYHLLWDVLALEGFVRARK